MACEDTEVGSRRWPDVLSRDVVAAFQLASDGVIVDATSALLDLVDYRHSAPVIGTPLRDFWHRHFVRPFADDELLAALRNVDDPSVIEASPTSPAGVDRTLQLRPVDESDGTVTVVVNDISELVEAQGRLMRCLAHERFLHLIATDLIDTRTNRPEQVIHGITSAIATYFNLTVAAIVAPASLTPNSSRVLGFSSRLGGKFADYAELFAESADHADVSSAPLTAAQQEQAHQIGLDSSHQRFMRTTLTIDLPTIDLPTIDLPTIDAPNDTSTEIQLLAVRSGDELDAVDHQVLQQTLTQIAHFHRNTNPALTHRETGHREGPVDAFACELRDAVLHGGLVVHYQPEFDLTTRRMVGAEALVRWPYQGRGLLPAGEFVPLATKLGLSTELSRLVLNEACSAAAGWLRQTPIADFTIRVNLSPLDVEDPGVVDRVLDAVHRAGLPPHVLCLEITESAVMHDYLAVLRHLNALADAGISLALDDFGTGYSSMWLLRELPFDTLKIDQIFVRSVASGRPEDRAIIETMVSLGAAFDMAVTAEGIETDEQLAELQRIGVGIGQGFLLAKPAPKEDVLIALTGPTDRR